MVLGVVRQYRFSLLLFSLLLLLVITPITDGSGLIGFVISGLLSYVLLNSIFVLSGDKRYLIAGLVLAVPYLVINWLFSFYPSSLLERFGLVLGTAFFFFTAIFLLLGVLRQRSIALESISAALSAYLLLGFSWAFVYSLIESFWPGSFAGTSSDIADPRYRFIYFSFVTMTTLGYGDITPTTPISQAWAILEAVIGQLYLVVVISGLIGAYFSSGSGSGTSSP